MFSYGFLLIYNYSLLEMREVVQTTQGTWYLAAQAPELFKGIMLWGVLDISCL